MNARKTNHFAWAAKPLSIKHSNKGMITILKGTDITTKQCDADKQVMHGWRDNASGNTETRVMSRSVTVKGSANKRDKSEGRQTSIQTDSYTYILVQTQTRWHTQRHDATQEDNNPHQASNEYKQRWLTRVRQNADQPTQLQQDVPKRKLERQTQVNHAKEWNQEYRRCGELESK